MKEADPNFERDYEQNMHSEREILHAIYPRQDYDPGRIDYKGKRWASDWVYSPGGKILPTSGSAKSEQDAVMLSEGGYDSMPIFSRGPSHDAWVAIATANQMGRTNLITGQKAAEPPLVADSALRNKIMRGPNGITFIDNTRGNIGAYAPVPLNGTGVQQLPFSIEYQEKVTQVIREHYQTDVFTLLTQLAQQGASERMVTAQINELMTEKAALLGTVVGNLQSECFDPLIERVYDIESRAGRIPDPPQILQDSEHEPIKVEYSGLLAQAQTRVTKMRSIQSVIAGLTQITQFDPIALHVVDTDDLVRQFYDASGAPESSLRSEKDIAKIRQMAQQQQEKQQQIENAPKIAKAAALAGKGADPDSPLRALMGAGKDQ